ncbi:MFS transporter [Verminephrobacter aporrectodeae subsp. tuberculatae]|uniref:MFS transporter n=1 Tax=Verminephrobacter aporrectodeae TaxID=1110389 RepID=UPI002243C98B|nr:MFS transporter [Verminephrobacter aporrectodeae]MCW8198216.1 MFS transporter [Verminephrobacter aporrectodeae subsp. tuberculatae]
MQNSAITLRGIDDVIAFIDSCPGIRGRAGVVWWLALGGLFLDAFSNSSLSAGLGPMTRDLQLAPAQVALLTSLAAWVAIAFNPIGGWMADRWGRVRPLILAKLLAVVGAVLVVLASDYALILVGRFLVGAAYGIDFAIAMAVLAEFTPARLKSRLNTWQGMWYVAVCSNLLLALLFHSWDVGDAIWRYSVAATAVVGLAILVLQYLFLVESPIWLARRERLDAAAQAMARIYGRAFSAAPPAERVPVTNQARRGLANVLLIFRGVYLPRTLLAATVQIAQSIQYFAVGWYLPLISAALFGKGFVYATTGALVFNLCGIFGGFLSPLIGRRLGLRRASAFGFAAVFAMLLILGLLHGKMPMWAAVVVPSLFILFHSGGPGANGKSLSSLSFRSELRAGANGIIGALGSTGAALGLLIFPLFRAKYGLETTFLILSVVPLLASIVCFSIDWDPTRTTVHPDNEPGAPQFEDDPCAQRSGLVHPAVGKSAP